MASRTMGESLGFAFAGIVHALRTQRNARVELAAGAVILGVTAWLRPGIAESAIVVLCVGMVLAAECVNTAIEALVDLASPEFHELARVAKDCAAAGVLCLSSTAGVVGACVLGPELWRRLVA